MLHTRLHKLGCTLILSTWSVSTWHVGLQHIFLHKDRAAHRMEQLQSSLETSIEAEDYEDAAEYSDDLARHQSFDDVTKIWDVSFLFSTLPQHLSNILAYVCKIAAILHMPHLCRQVRPFA